ncbi:MAG: hypothetical protein Kow0027_24870 [Saprospiraceae bacterium]
MTAPIPPMENEKMRLSMSKPVFSARLNKEGGDQYSGIKSGSVNPNKEVQILTLNISNLNSGLLQYIIAQLHNAIKDHISHAYFIVIYLVLW